jgi:2-polyprenyl-3-methyl-5-hydroxy-6-metoxy-1,4-benzoquinol methylase
MKILVVIANYGQANQPYLFRVLEEYRRMPYDVDIVVVSDVPKELGDDVEVTVGLPDPNPWSLPFAHKKVLADRRNDYDLFIYSEDDVLVTQRNIEAFLEMTRVLPKDELAGFLRIETGDEGKTYFIDSHSHYHWQPGSVRERGEETFAFFTNEHAGLYMLNREQLRRVIESGAFLVKPHDERYNLPETAATDPYTQCGFRKMICLSRLDDVTVPHLPNKKHKGRPYAEKGEFSRQIETLLQVQKEGQWKSTLCEANPKVGRGKWSKNYYEPHDPFSDPESVPDIRSHIPAQARSVLSIGCGWGALEGELVQRGVRVVGVPIDPVIAACARAKGIKIVPGQFEDAREALANERFDCILISYILHLVPDPAGVVSLFAELLSSDGCMVIAAPNFVWPTLLWKRVWRDPRYEDLGNYDKTGIHLTTKSLIGKWFRDCDLKVGQTADFTSQRAKSASRFSFGLGSMLLASDFIAVGTRK